MLGDGRPGWGAPIAAGNDLMATLNLDTFLDGLPAGEAAHLASLYDAWAADPKTVAPGWGSLFGALANGGIAATNGAGGVPRTAGPATSAAAVRAATTDSIRALMLIRAYRVRGHLEAKLDPLGLTEVKPHPELDPASYGFSEADMDREIFIDMVLGLETATLRQIVKVLRETYCGSIGVEFMHIQSPEQKTWIQRRIEGAPWLTAFDANAKREILSDLTRAEGFEVFCQKKYVGTKRFGIEGGESVIAALRASLATAAAGGVSEVVIGMPHRGRLNTLVNVMGKPLAAVFSEFQGNSAAPEDVQGSGDVKYHLGTSTDVELAGRQVHLSLQANPSHLEAVDPVVIGKVRAKQDLMGDVKARRGAMGVMMHGDAAFAGQGVVAEVLAMSQLVGYRTGGTVHFIVNNQIGFTTVPRHAYSGLYCTDIAKSVQAPILHVNGDDPEAVVFAARLITEFRNEFGVDAVLDIVCYRRHGHNEADEPAFTQPLMYKRIREQKTTRTLYAEKLAAEGSIPADESARVQAGFNATLDAAFQAAATYKPNKADWLEGQWTGFSAANQDDEVLSNTGVAAETLVEVGAALARPPQNFDLNPKILRQLEAKKAAIDAGQGIDWATGEALAFGSLLLEGHRVRLSGEDVQRGTFSQRHAYLIDQTTQGEYVPLNTIRDGQAQFDAFNSLLSEFGVLGFDYGYSLADPRSLVLWEAQFGDFANGAQVILDQFIASGETKWLRMSGLVMLLPHGYEGQGPEHSSARLERYLQLCAERNMQVCNLTTPANYFHALRRQLKRDFRKPLVVMTPKSLLRHKLAVSALADLQAGTHFRFVYPEADALADDAKVRRVVLCSGKVYYDLLAERREAGAQDVAILRIEQLYPFPARLLAAQLARYPNAEVVWCQEEPENMGAWHFLDRRIEAVLAGLSGKAKRPAFVGRREAASPATGLARTHNSEQKALVAAALAA
jgi:2-oxoglutarate dehydrogenase E1 component